MHNIPATVILMKLRRWHMKYIAIAGVILFFTVLLLLFSSISNHQKERKSVSPQQIAVNLGIEANFEDDNDSTLLNRELRAKNRPGSGPLVTTGLWMVLCVDGVDVYSDVLLSTNSLHTLSYGSIVIGHDVTLDRSVDSTRETSVLTLKLSYPISGYVAIRSEAKFNLKLLKQNLVAPRETVLAVKEDPPVNLCSDSSNVNLDHDYRGGDLSNVPNPVDMPSSKECCEQCYATPDCYLWTFTDSKQCWLKGDGARLMKMKPKPAPVVAGNAVVSTSDGFVCGRSKPSSGGNNALITPDVMSAHLNVLNEIEYCDASDEPLIDNNTLLKSLTGANPALVHPSIVLDMTANKPLPAPLNPYLLRSSYRTTGDWREQHLIGTGSVGLMVGGTLHYEVVPISIAGLFTKKAVKSKPFPKGKKAPPQPISSSGSGSFNGSVFQQARTAFLAGQFVDAEDLINSHIDKNLGMFEYVMDLTTSYSTFPFVVKSVAVDEVKNLKSASTKPKPRPPLRNPFGIGRSSLLRKIDSLFEYRASSNLTISVKPKFDKVEYSDHCLDLKHGVSRSSFIELVTLPSQDRISRVHTREWFASAVDDVAVQSASCYDMRQKKKGCLNVVQMLSRDDNNKPGPTVIKSGFQTAKLTDSVLQKWGKQSVKRVDSYSYTMELTGSADVSLPTTVACGAILCVGQKMNTFVTSSSALSESLVVCNNADQLYHITAVVSGTPTTANSKMVEQCLSRVNNALKKGIRDLRIAHTQYTSTHMTGTQVVFAEKPQQQQKNRHCADVSMLDRLSQYSIDPSNDPELLNQLYQYGRFLALSSATQAVPNLQGVWGDGVMAAWNGDYHLNINLQMMYWGMEGAGLGEMTIQPLRRFIQKMRLKGQETAKSMYGAQNPNSWVGHGFTDSEMNMIIQAGAEWSLCVTCGAWVALQLWEHLIHNNLDKKMQQEILVGELIPTLRGVMTFFLEYAYFEWSGDGLQYVVHTGPTTSPENSYAIVLNDGTIAEVPPVPEAVVANPRVKNKPPPPKQDRVNFLVMSPAIDISLLRQVSNAFTLSVDWVDSPAGTTYEREPDQDLAKRFRDFVAHMANKAMPTTTEVSTTLKKGVVRDGGEGTSVVSVVEEYPSPLPKQNYKRIDMVDKGHRHFSVLHWLYPNTFLPHVNEQHDDATVQHLLSAAANTMRSKRDNGGGHTGWSAVWEACLYARLGLGEQLQESLNHLIGRYLTSNLLTLHPPLGKVGPSNCGTCYGETDGKNPAVSDAITEQKTELVQKYLKKQIKEREADAESLRKVDKKQLIREYKESVVKSLSEDHSAEWLNSNRGLVTARDDKFQLDANLGLMAVVHEMLVQSHIPGAIHLLPALPIALASGGVVRSLHLRGDVKIWFEWTNGRITVGKLLFGSYHPWLSGITEESSGFYTVNKKVFRGNSLSLSLTSPNQLREFTCPNDRCTSKAIESFNSASECLHSVSDAASKGPYDGSGDKVYKRTFSLHQKCLPYSVYFCDAGLSATECTLRMEELFTHHKK